MDDPAGARRAAGAGRTETLRVDVAADGTLKLEDTSVIKNPEKLSKRRFVFHFAPDPEIGGPGVDFPIGENSTQRIIAPIRWIRSSSR